MELIVPFAPGGSTDLIARTLAKAIEKPLGETMVVINRDGAAGAVGTREVVGAGADGYKIVFPPSSLFTLTPQLVNNPSTVELDELRIITGLTVENIVLVAHKDSPFKTIDDVLALKASGRRITCGHSGVVPARTSGRPRSPHPADLRHAAGTHGPGVPHPVRAAPPAGRTDKAGAPAEPGPPAQPAEPGPPPAPAPHSGHNEPAQTAPRSGHDEPAQTAD